MQIRERDIHVRVKNKAKTERLVRTKVEATTGSSDLDGGNSGFSWLNRKARVIA